MNMQLFAYSCASLTLQSPVGFSFICLHHASLPTSGEQPDANKISIANDTPDNTNLIIQTSPSAEYDIPHHDHTYTCIA